MHWQRGRTDLESACCIADPAAFATRTQVKYASQQEDSVKDRLLLTATLCCVVLRPGDVRKRQEDVCLVSNSVLRAPARVAEHERNHQRIHPAGLHEADAAAGTDSPPQWRRIWRIR